MDGSKRLKAQGGRERYARQLSSQMSKDDHSKLWGSSIEDAFPVKKKIALPKAYDFEIEMARGLHGENKLWGRSVLTCPRRFSLSTDLSFSVTFSALSVSWAFSSSDVLTFKEASPFSNSTASLQSFTNNLGKAFLQNFNSYGIQV